jgi:hypothetical protein
MKTGVGGGWIESEKVFVAVSGAGSITVTTTLLLVPTALGVPLIMPVDGSIVRPVGWPLIDQVKDPVPPVAATAKLYGIPWNPVGSGEGDVMASGVTTIVIEKVAVAIWAVGVVKS